MHEHNIPKGLKRILLERRLLIEKRPKQCGAKFAIGANPACCAIHRLDAQPDFRAQKSILYKAIGKTFHSICDFLPNFIVNLPQLKTSGVVQRNIRNQTVIIQLLP